MISGQTTIKTALFYKYYAIPIITAANNGHSFVIGCADGVDKLAFDLIYNRLGLTDRVILYNKATVPDWTPEDFPVDISSKSWTERDNLLLDNSTGIIAFVENTLMAFGSGTARNIVGKNNNDDKEDFFTFTRSGKVTQEEILEKYPCLKSAVMY
jgi:hypothetical protein